MAAITNNFTSLIADFKKDTGLEYGEETKSLYMQYASARFADASMQYLEMIEEKQYLIEDEIKNVIDTLTENFDAVSQGIFEIRKALIAKKELA
jgi:hypothetical protein